MKSQEDSNYISNGVLNIWNELVFLQTLENCLVQPYGVFLEQPVDENNWKTKFNILINSLTQDSTWILHFFSLGLTFLCILWVINRENKKNLNLTHTKINSNNHSFKIQYKNTTISTTSSLHLWQTKEIHTLLL